MSASARLFIYARGTSILVFLTFVISENGFRSGSPPSEIMVVAYVRLFSLLGPQPSLPASRIYALLLPSATSCEWDEICIQRSTLGGQGVFPSDAGQIDWCDVGATPVLMPYLGADTVVHDAHTLRSLVEVLQGSFECVTVGELRAKGGTRQPHVADGLFAVP